jgi:hypothetical protein
MSKSEKSAYIRHIFVNTFFHMEFFTTFSTDSKSASNSAFYSIKCPYFCLFWGSVQMHSGLRVVNIDFQPLGMKSDHKEAEFWGQKI